MFFQNLRQSGTSKKDSAIIQSSSITVALRQKASKSHLAIHGHIHRFHVGLVLQAHPEFFPAVNTPDFKILVPGTLLIFGTE